MGAATVKVADFVVLELQAVDDQGFLVLGFLSLVSAPFSLSLSLALVLAASSSSSEGSRRTTTRRVLSGDHAKSSTSCGVSVRCWASPPSD